jgi:Ni/Fe-hydrogenase subunit HybB-like protein
MNTLSETAPATRNSQWLMHLGIAVIVTVVAGFYAVSQLMTHGHAAFNTTNYGVFWGLAIVTYDYFLLTSTGLVMVAGIYHLLGFKSFGHVAKRALWLGFAGLVGGVAVLFLELGNPWIAIYAVPFNGQTASPLFWKVLLVGAYTIVLAMALWTMMKNGDTGRSTLAKLAAVLALVITLVAGLVYGMMAMRPMWFSGEVPVVFLIESLVGGLAFVMVFSHLAAGFSHDGMQKDVKALFNGPMVTLFAALIALHLTLHVGRAITGSWSNAEGLQVWQYILSGPLFWVGLIGCTLLPLVLMLLPGTRTSGMMQLLAGLLVLVGLFISRYEFIIGGQQAPLFKGSWQQGLVEYVPSNAEWALLLLGIGLANAVYAFAAWKLGAEDATD